MAEASAYAAEQIAIALRSNAETQKFVEKQAKLWTEAAKLERDRTLAPWQIAAAGAALFGASIAFVKLFLP